jgi:acetyltransferase-like isoleucine patch superfamily enzyme
MTTGAQVSFGSCCHIYEPRAGLSIGDHCMIGGGVLICGVNYGHASRTLPMRQQPCTTAPIRLEPNVRVGMGAILLPGITIGAGAIIGAGAVVTADVPAGSVVAGLPARILKERT